MKIRRLKFWFNFLLLLFLGSGIILSSCRESGSGQKATGKTSTPASLAVEQAYRWMDSIQYDSAQVVLQNALRNARIEEDSLNWYYLHSFLSEIMYYHALFTEGRALNKQALAVAQAMGDSVLVGNCCNFSGLFLLNQDQPEEALKYFRRAANLIPENHRNRNITYRYQVLSNMAETFLALHQPDSALFYIALSDPEARKQKMQRGIAINFWIAGECMLEKKEFAEADRLFEQALQQLKGTPHSDIREFVLASLIESAVGAKNKNLVILRLREGIKYAVDSKNTTFSHISFFESAVQAARLFSLPEAAQLETEFFVQNRNRESESVQQRTAALSIYYANQKKLMEAEAQKRESRERMEQSKRQQIILLLLLLLAILLLILAGVYLRQRYKLTLLLHQEELFKAETRRELDLLKEKNRVIEEERNRIARELHDQIGSSMSSILIYSGLASDKYRNNTDKQLEMAVAIQSLASEISENLSDLIWAIQSKNDNIEKLVERMKAYSFQLFSALGIDIEFQLDYQLAGLKPDWEWRKNLLMFFKEAVNNIAKHSKATHVKVSLLQKGEEMGMEITDNGCGFEPGSRSQGNGLKTLQSRGLGMKGRTEIFSEIGKGTKISCYMPVP